MEEPNSQSVPWYRVVTIIAGVVLILLYTTLVIALGATGVLPWPKASLPIASKPTATPTPTITVLSTPRILVHAPSDASIVRTMDFSKGIDGWQLYYVNGKVENIKGQLVLQSNITNQAAIAMNASFLSPGAHYYVQADFTTDIPTNGGYGLVFGADRKVGTYYLFDLWPRAHVARLQRVTQGSFQQLGKSAAVHLATSLQSNTLSVYYDRGYIELYLNGTQMLTYTDTEPLHSTGIGAFVSGPGFTVKMDNVFGYSIK